MSGKKNKFKKLGKGICSDGKDQGMFSGGSKKRSNEEVEEVSDQSSLKKVRQDLSLWFETPLPTVEDAEHSHRYQ